MGKKNPKIGWEGKRKVNLEKLQEADEYDQPHCMKFSKNKIHFNKLLTLLPKKKRRSLRTLK